MNSDRAGMPIDPALMAIVSHLSRYWRAHPDACDTSGGIARWWIDGIAQPVSVAQVEAALEWMSAFGVVETLHAADGRVRYRRADAGAGGDLQATMDALADDPRSLLGPGTPPQEPPRDS